MRVFDIGTKVTFAQKPNTIHMYTVQLHLSGSSIHVAYLYLTRVISYKVRWNCDILLEPTNFLKFGL